MLKPERSSAESLLAYVREPLGVEGIGTMAPSVGGQHLTCLFPARSHRQPWSQQSRTSLSMSLLGSFGRLALGLLCASGAPA
jgi:hypothetical protein